MTLGKTFQSAASLCISASASRKEFLKKVNTKMRSRTDPKCQFGEVTTCIVASPIGNIAVRSCPNGLHSVGQIGGLTDETFKPDAKQKVKWISGPEPGTLGNTPMLTCIQWLEEYFRNPAAIDGVAKPPLCLPPFESASFREKVWLTLAARVGAGQTVSYGQLAKLVDNPRAAQAVGSAMATNPFQLIVPCHRVIRSDATLGLYAKGTLNTVKKWLLKHEGCQL